MTDPRRWDSGTRRILTCALLLVAAWVAQPALAKEPPRAKPVPGAGNALDVPYLPPNRLSNTGADSLVKMNIHWPDDGKKHPCVIIVHGGGYGGGDKEEGLYHNLAVACVKKGFVAVNLNYILGDDIFPQVYWDFKAAVRFLRKNANQYNIDPEHIGGWGFSAGGWLISSAGWSDAGDTFVSTSLAISATRPADPNALATHFRKRPRFALAMDDPRPPYPEFSSRLQAMAVDWTHHSELLTPDDPAVLTYVGEGGVSRLEAAWKRQGLGGEVVVVTGPKHKGAASIHVPSLDSPTLAEDGKTASPLVLRERVLAFFDRRLRTQPQTVAPEIRPNARGFAKDTKVQFVTASPDASVHYTLDGSEPTAASPKYTDPFTLTATTTVKAIAVRPGSRPSGPAIAVFTAGGATPAITGPDTLPRGKVGQPYSVQFSAAPAAADKPAMQWRLDGQHRGPGPNAPKEQKGFTNFVGLAMDPQTGTLAGTPLRAGAYVLLVQAAHGGPGQSADGRTYLLLIDP